jgi:hypothetical protein
MPKTAVNTHRERPVPLAPPIGPRSLPAPTNTYHEAGSWNVHRHTLVEHAHEVNGVPYIGGAGLPLDDALRATWRNEASQLTHDLVTVLHQLPKGQARAVLDDLVDQLRPLWEGEPVPEPMSPAEAGRRAETGEWHDAASALDAHRDPDTGDVTVS